MGNGGLRFFIVSVLLVAGGCSDSQITAEPVSDVPSVEAVIGSVSNEATAVLQAEVDRLQGIVDSLQRELAEARARMDLAGSGAAASDARVVERDVRPAALMNLRVVEVNRDMGVSVIDGGSQSGIRTGMSFHVLRDDRVIARLKIVDVRDRIAGGLIEGAEDDWFPEKGDRVVLSTKQDG